MLPRNASIKDIETPWKDDWLEYKGQAKTLKSLFAKQKGPLVISVNAPFGMGKTFFAKNFQADLKEQGAKAIYFNAWEEDFAGAPLLSLVSAIQEQLGLEDNAEILRPIIKFAYKIFLGSAKGFLDATTFGIGRVLEGMIDGAAKETLDEVGDLFEESFQEKKRSIIEFKKLLEKLHEEICGKANEVHGNGNGLKGNIYIIVDEIDRCNPEYSLKLLEEVKHLFSVKGYIFIIMSDYERLNNMASATYGGNAFGSEGYMNKFFDIKCALKHPKKTIFLKKSLSVSNISPSYLENYINLFSYIVESSNMSLRQIVDAVNMFRILHGDSPLLLFLIFCASYNFSKFESMDFNYFISEFKIDNRSVEYKYIKENRRPVSFIDAALSIRYYLGDKSIGDLKNHLPSNYVKIIDSYMDGLSSESNMSNLNYYYNLARLSSAN